MAGTMAVSERTSPPQPIRTHVSPHLHNWLAETDIATLPAGLHRRIVQFLSMAENLGRDSRWERAKELATELNPYVAPAPPEGTMPEQSPCQRSSTGKRSAEFAKQQRRAEQSQAFRAGVNTLPHGRVSRAAEGRTPTYTL